jgi:hypothetical protein
MRIHSNFRLFHFVTENGAQELAQDAARRHLHRATEALLGRHASGKRSRVKRVFYLQCSIARLRLIKVLRLIRVISVLRVYSVLRLIRVIRLVRILSFISILSAISVLRRINVLRVITVLRLIRVISPRSQCSSQLSLKSMPSKYRSFFFFFPLFFYIYIYYLFITISFSICDDCSFYSFCPGGHSTHCTVQSAYSSTIPPCLISRALFRFFFFSPPPSQQITCIRNHPITANTGPLRCCCRCQNLSRRSSTFVAASRATCSSRASTRVSSGHVVSCRARLASCFFLVS